MWYSVGSTIYMAGMWVITILIVIISGYTDNGIFGIAMSSTNVFSTISLWGMRNYQISDLNGKYTDNSYIMSRIFTCIVSIAACAVFVLVKGFSSEQSWCILLYMIFKISEAVADVYNGIVQKHWRMDIIGKSYVARAVLTVAAFCLTLKFTGSLKLAIVSMIVCSFAVILSYDVVQAVRIAHIKIKFDFHGIDKLLIQCAPLIVCAFLYSFNALLPRLYLEEIYGATVLGYYAAIASPALIIQLLASFIYAPLIPLFSKSHTDKDTHAFSRLLIKTLLALLGISVFSVIGGYLLGDWGLSVLYGSRKDVDILNYAYLLVPTIFTAIGIAYIWLLNGVITAIRQIKALFFSAIVGSVVCIAISKYFVVTYGANGINFSMIIVQLVQIILMLLFVIRYIRKGHIDTIND